MTSNSPFFPAALKRRLFVAYPGRPAALGARAFHGPRGHRDRVLDRDRAALEQAIRRLTLAALVMMTSFHGFITSNVPMGVPIEWNIMMVYGGCFLFGPSRGERARRGLAAAARGVPARLPRRASRCSATSCPSRVSFLLAMRYYAGNWAYSVWLFRGDSYRKLDRLVKAAAPCATSSSASCPTKTSPRGAMLLSSVNRLLHLQGKRAATRRCPRAVDQIERLRVDRRRARRRARAGLELRRRPPERSPAAAGDPGPVRLRSGRAALRDGRVAAALRRGDALEDCGREDRCARGGRVADRAAARVSALAHREARRGHPARLRRGRCTASSVATSTGLPWRSPMPRGGLGVAPVLALVELDDAVEAVIREERPVRTTCAWFAWMPMPRKTTASTSGCAQIRSRTSGMVSRVSPPARSIGLCRLQRAGTSASMRGAQIVGQRDHLEPGRGAGVGGEHAPAAGGGEDDDAPAARQRLRREGRGPLERLLDGRRAQRRRAGGRRRRRRGRRWRASRCGWRRRAGPRAAAPPFSKTSGLARGEARARRPGSAAVADAFQVGQRDGASSGSTAKYSR